MFGVSTGAIASITVLDREVTGNGSVEDSSRSRHLARKCGVSIIMTTSITAMGLEVAGGGLVEA
jgi:hypothetical protein